jgi:hypothetical protein
MRNYEPPYPHSIRDAYETLGGVVGVGVGGSTGGVVSGVSGKLWSGCAPPPPGRPGLCGGFTPGRSGSAIGCVGSFFLSIFSSWFTVRYESYPIPR